ncbi:hypothetical protein [Streptomyces sp. NPDC059611]|uniref:hypothetical protein n=1 Tax=Streptomyces sp. NPDC059611 TaxID=3346884 RepID=UPI003693B0D3
MTCGSVGGNDLPYRVGGQRGALLANTLYDVFPRPTRLEFSATPDQEADRTLLHDEPTDQDEQKSTDTRCFTNDPLDRLSEAWTAKTDCAAPLSASTAGGSDATPSPI